MSDKTKIEQVAKVCGWDFFPQGEFLSDRWEGPDGDWAWIDGALTKCGKQDIQEILLGKGWEPWLRKDCVALIGSNNIYATKLFPDLIDACLWAEANKR